MPPSPDIGYVVPSNGGYDSVFAKASAQLKGCLRGHKPRGKDRDLKWIPARLQKPDGTGAQPIATFC